MSNLADDYTAGLPPACVKLKDGATDKSDPHSWDGWAVEPTGDPKSDYLKGAEYCDTCVRKVAGSGNPGALSFTLTCMILKVGNGVIKNGDMEKGFMDRLALLASQRRQEMDGVMASDTKQ